MSEKAGGKGGSDEEIAFVIGLGVLVLVLAAAAKWGRRMVKDTGPPALAFVADVWASYWGWMVVALAGVAGLLVWRWWSRRRWRLRAGRAELVVASLAAVMPAGWDPGEQFRIRRYRGIRPDRMRIGLTAQCPDLDVDWRRAVASALSMRLGPLEPIGWPAPQSRRRRIDVRVLREQPDREAPGGDIPLGGLSPGAIRDRLEPALAGLVPKADVEVGPVGDSGYLITVGYGETTRDQSLQWRARVVDQASARMGQRYRADWDRRSRHFTLGAVPHLPGTILWEQAVSGFRQTKAGRWVAAYGTDEDGATVAWEMGDATPHAMFVGETGSGKTEAMKALLCTLITLGVLVVILDPKQKDFAEFLGRPGVVCVATSIEDQVGALIDVVGEMHRRTAAAALRRLEAQHPELAGDGPLSAQAAIDGVPLVLFIDETTQLNADMQKWWSGLSKSERESRYGSAAAKPPMMKYPGDIVQLARAIKIHVVLGMQRADAANFGDSTQMRDNLAHLASMGTASPIGSEMVWGDRLTGSNVVIEDVGEGVSNGLRISPQGQRGAARSRPGRFKAWYTADVAERQEFWDGLEGTSPDASLVDLPSVSAAARDPKAAIEALRAKAYHTQPDPVPSLAPGAQRARDIPSEVIMPVSPGPGPAESSRAAPTVEPSHGGGNASPSLTAMDQTAADDHEVVELDAEGRGWESVAATQVEVGDTIALGDIAAAEVVDVPGWVEDEFSGDEVFRVVLLEDGEEQVVDLGGEEGVYRRAA